MALNWKSVGSVLFGAIISALISYWFTKWRENQRLKIDLQVKTADLLIDTVKTLNNASSIMTSHNFAFLKGYNITLEHNPIAEEETDPNDLFHTTRMINEIRQNQIEVAKENVRKTYSNMSETWENYSKAFLPIISILESKEVILHRFIGFRYLLLDEFKVLMELQNDLSNLYLNEISQSLTYSKPIEEATIQKAHELRYKFNVKCWDICCIMLDLQVGLQNEFLSKLFKHKVPLRQPQDKTLPVYKSGFVYEMKDSTKV